MSLIPPSVGNLPPQGNEEQNELAAEYRKTVVEIQSQLFDKAATYSNLIMVAGYAGMFTVWGNTRNQLPAHANILVALLLGFSLCVFVSYQIYKMSVHVNHFRRVRALLRESLPLQEFFDRHNELDRQVRNMTLQSGATASFVCFLAAVIPSIFTLDVLFYDFAASLVGIAMWPQ